VAVMQNSSNAAAAISIVNFMAHSLFKVILPERIAASCFSDGTLSPKRARALASESARSLHKIKASHRTNNLAERVSISE
jgi:hypothetical protein